MAEPVGDILRSQAFEHGFDELGFGGGEIKCSWILEEMGAATHSTRKTWELLHEPLLQHIFLLDLFLQNFCKT